MRVIAGTLGGRSFDSPHGHRTHPMSDKIRGALFSILGELDGLTVLDAFAGSGALSFEAVSRGAKSALAIEQDRSAQQTITRNISALGLGAKVALVAASANAWLQTNQTARFDIVLCDPPYDDMQLNLVTRLAGVVRSGGLLVLSAPGHMAPLALAQLELIQQRSYGDAQLLFYRA